MEKAMQQIRDRIDSIDSEILVLLKERLGCAGEIGLIKKNQELAVCDPAREKQILDRLSKDNNGVFPEKALRTIFQEIITTCRLSQSQEDSQ